MSENRMFDHSGWGPILADAIAERDARKALLATRPPRRFVQFDGFAADVGDVVFGGAPTVELMAGADVRVLIPAGTNKEAALRLLRKLTERIEGDGIPPDYGVSIPAASPRKVASGFALVHDDYDYACNDDPIPTAVCVLCGVGPIPLAPLAIVDIENRRPLCRPCAKEHCPELYSDALPEPPEDEDDFVGLMKISVPRAWSKETRERFSEEVGKALREIVERFEAEECQAEAAGLPF